jgi:hypothetical protein
MESRFGWPVRLARRLARTAGIDTDHDVALRDPPLRVHGLPVHVGPVLLDLGIEADAIPVLEMDVLRIGPQRDDRRMASFRVGPEHVGA